ncbi:charged multivesicular body protein 2A [Trypanosoma rangeli]|uniref:Charged multivesicular body protein 2A n=1 Tax=Trypanosoma rangeli TaxID=5698 RepID=A0A3S5IQV4_TRYRA|nr:charged multivesicular body protein 2A [Trypanosoma rangeli]RNF02605.1 charged multivesicular body protein 2A [Trypanosoma rangeli]|eukprot:RNF02605.1 charged multivesicular body protein 2A [Trypanosoma rangeli]
MSFLRDLFHRETPQEAMRKYKRGLDRTIRDIDRERNKLQAQERKIVIDMKKMAKQDQIDSVRILARDLVRTRKYQQKMYRMRTQIQGVSLRIQTMQSTGQMATAMKGVTKAMRSMNNRMNIPEMQRVMREFEKQNEMMGMKEEMMNDVVDDVMDDDGEEEDETELEIQKVMDEVGLEFKSKMGITDASLPARQQENEDDDKELEARLAALKSSMK